MKNSIVIVILLCLFSSTVKGQSLRTYNFDKKEVIQKIKEEQWAKDAYENIRIKIDVLCMVKSYRTHNSVFSSFNFE